MAILKVSLATFGLLLASSCSAAAQSCWRNTTCSPITETAFPGKWESNIYAPSSRTVTPKSVLSLATGEVISSYPGINKLERNGSALVFDFGIEVGGIVSIEYSVTGSGRGAVGLAFTEAKNWIGEWSDASNGAFKGPDGALYSNFSGPGSMAYTMPDAKIRGGFRYLTLFLVAPSASVEVRNISLEIGFQPTWPNLRAYQGYFHSNDETLNAIWYSGAYTLQTNAVPPNTGRKASPMATSGWMNDGYLGPGDTIIVDGAKRDRAVWPGDMGVAVPSTFVSTGDLESVKNALQVIYDYQNADGSFPEAGPPLLQQDSDTYHMWTMIGTYNYMLYTNDTAFLSHNWRGYLRAMAFINSKVRAPLNLLYVTGTRDWARFQTSGYMCHAQMILYRTLTTGAELASWAVEAGLPSSYPIPPSSSSSPPPSPTNLTTTFLTLATTLQTSTLTHCFSPSHSAFKDNATLPTTSPLSPSPPPNPPTSIILPQDANALSLAFHLLPPTHPLTPSISHSLTASWTPLGPSSPELLLPAQISPFTTSFELLAHLHASQTLRSLQLIRSLWGWYLTHPNGTGSTTIEGFLVDGTFGYRFNRGYSETSYVSHAHGWSAGPTSVLSEFVVGLRVMGRRGGRWVFGPQMGDLEWAEGGWTVGGVGRFRAGWRRGYGGKGVDGNRVFVGGRRWLSVKRWMGVGGGGGGGRNSRRGGEEKGYEATVDVPVGTMGEFRLPVLVNGEKPSIIVNGEVVADAKAEWYRRRDPGDDSGGDNDVVVIRDVPGGNYTIQVS